MILVSLFMYAIIIHVRNRYSLTHPFASFCARAQKKCMVEFVGKETHAVASNHCQLRVNETLHMYWDKKRWRDQMSRDLQAIGWKEDWYQVCQDRTVWCQRCQVGVDKVASCRKKSICPENSQSQEKTFVCECGRIFR